METLIKLNTQTAGRDKIARLFQYLSRLLWHRLQLKGKDGVNNLKNLEFQLSTFRKLLRFGRCIDSLYSSLPVLSHPDSTVSLTITLSKICNSLFLLADHMLWLGRADLCTVNIDKWSRISNKFWLYSITMNLVRDFYEIYNLLKQEKACVKPSHGVNNLREVGLSFARVVSVLQSNRNVMVDTIKNGCDFFIPLTALGHVKLSPGTIGLLGTVSSIAGLMVLIDPKIKLSPS